MSGLRAARGRRVSGRRVSTVLATLLALGLVAAGAVVAQTLEEPGGWLRQFDGARSGALLAPPSHVGDWPTTHGLAIDAAGGASCSSCHSESWCSDCHGGGRVGATIHQPGFAAIHGFEALGGTAACTSCHVEQVFCQACHLQTRWSPEPQSRPATGVFVHPPGWIEMEHADEARRDLTQCASCHTEESCASCHAFVNPHGAGMLQDCARMLEAGAPTCVTCHTSTASIGIAEVLV